MTDEEWVTYHRTLGFSAENAARLGPQARAEEDIDATVLEDGYDAARRAYGDRYADYLIEHDRELRTKGHTPRPWPLSLQGNNGP